MEELPPEVKQVVPLELFAECEEKRGLPAGVKSLKFDDVQATSVDMEGLPPTTSIVYFKATTLDGEVKPDWISLVRDGDGERFFVPEQYEYDAYVRDRCPPPVAPAPEAGLRVGAGGSVWSLRLRSRGAEGLGQGSDNDGLSSFSSHRHPSRMDGTGGGEIIQAASDGSLRRFRTRTRVGAPKNRSPRWPRSLR